MNQVREEGIGWEVVQEVGVGIRGVAEGACQEGGGTEAKVELARSGKSKLLRELVGWVGEGRHVHWSRYLLS